MERLTTDQAADRLGISVDAVRGRIKRGTLEHERQGHKVYVLLEGDQSATSGQPANDQPDEQSELVEVLKEQVEDLRSRLDRETEANRENRRIIAGLIERVPELEAPRADEHEGQEPSGPGAEGSSAPDPGEGNIERPRDRLATAWRRIFDRDR